MSAFCFAETFDRLFSEVCLWSACRGFDNSVALSAAEGDIY